MENKAEARSLAFSSLGHQLSSVSTPVRAAEIIMEVADKLIGWDASSLFLYLPEKVIRPVLVMDIVDGKRCSVPPAYDNVAPSPLIQTVLSEGGKLILRDTQPTLNPNLVPFGDKSRPSASLMFVPARYGNEVVGILSIQSYTAQAYTSEDLETLQALADHCGGALERIQAQEKISQLAAIVESSNDAVIGKSLHNTITSWNAGAEKILGYAKSEVIGESITLLLPPDRLEEETQTLEMIQQGGPARRFETLRKRKDGSIIEVFLTASPIKDINGELKGVSTILQDITERKLTEKRLKGLSQLGKRLSEAATPKEAGMMMAEIAQELFGWDALTLDAYSPENDKISPIWSIDTINGEQVEAPSTHTPATPTRIARRIMALGSELVLKQGPLKIAAGDVPFGDISRPSASIMRVAIQYHNRIIALMSVHSYQHDAYDQSDLSTLQTFANYCAGALARIWAEEKMSTLNSQLLNSARRSGMEDAANQVLHNVGNVLTSVNISANLVTESLRNSKLNGLNRVNALLQGGLHDLGQFFRENLQAKQLPQHLEALEKYWTAEQSTLLDELERLNKHVLHIKSIISRQQSVAGVSGIIETVFISDLLEDALALGGADLAQSGINIIREYTMHFQVNIDKIKLMVILVNLIANAQDSLQASSQKRRQLKLRTEARQDHFYIVISDNGAGIAPENLTRIFSQGFTTKKNGHGFGLHGSALAARELGGSLSGFSAGLGAGAEFTLALPLESSRKTHKLP